MVKSGAIVAKNRRDFANVKIGKAGIGVNPRFFSVFSCFFQKVGRFFRFLRAIIAPVRRFRAGFFGTITG